MLLIIRRLKDLHRIVLKIRGFRFNIISTTGCLNVVVVVHVVAFVVVVVVVVFAVVVDVVVFVVVSPTGHFILSIFFKFHR